jgi:S-adenosylmethionine/arginine decarboxylase-like enzyme
VHTWPEHLYAAIDVFCCGDNTPEQAESVLSTVLEPAHIRCMKLERGFPSQRLGPVPEPDPPGRLYPGLTPRF